MLFIVPKAMYSVQMFVYCTLLTHYDHQYHGNPKALRDNLQ